MVCCESPVSDVVSTGRTGLSIVTGSKDFCACIVCPILGVTLGALRELGVLGGYACVERWLCSGSASIATGIPGKDVVARLVMLGMGEMGDDTT